MNIYERKDRRLEGRIYLGKDENGKRKYKSFYGSTMEEVVKKYTMAQLSLVPQIAVTKKTVSDLAS